MEYYEMPQVDKSASTYSPPVTFVPNLTPRPELNKYGVSSDILTSCDWSAVIHRPAEDSEPEDLPSTVDMDAIKEPATPLPPMTPAPAQESEDETDSEEASSNSDSDSSSESNSESQSGSGSCSCESSEEEESTGGGGGGEKKSGGGDEGGGAEAGGGGGNARSSASSRSPSPQTTFSIKASNFDEGGLKLKISALKAKQQPKTRSSSSSSDPYDSSSSEEEPPPASQNQPASKPQQQQQRSAAGGGTGGSNSSTGSGKPLAASPPAVVAAPPPPQQPPPPLSAGRNHSREEKQPPVSSSGGRVKQQPQQKKRSRLPVRQRLPVRRRRPVRRSPRGKHNKTAGGDSLNSWSSSSDGGGDSDESEDEEKTRRRGGEDLTAELLQSDHSIPISEHLQVINEEDLAAILPDVGGGSLDGFEGPAPPPAASSGGSSGQSGGGGPQPPSSLSPSSSDTELLPEQVVSEAISRIQVEEPPLVSSPRSSRDEDSDREESGGLYSSNLLEDFNEKTEMLSRSGGGGGGGSSTAGAGGSSKSTSSGQQEGQGAAGGGCSLASAAGGGSRKKRGRPPKPRPGPSELEAYPAQSNVSPDSGIQSVAGSPAHQASPVASPHHHRPPPPHRRPPLLQYEEINKTQTSKGELKLENGGKRGPGRPKGGRLRKKRGKAPRQTSASPATVAAAVPPSEAKKSGGVLLPPSATELKVPPYIAASALQATQIPSLPGIGGKRGRGRPKKLPPVLEPITLPPKVRPRGPLRLRQHKHRRRKPLTLDPAFVAQLEGLVVELEKCSLGGGSGGRHRATDPTAGLIPPVFRLKRLIKKRKASTKAADKEAAAPSESLAPGTAAHAGGGAAGEEKERPPPPPTASPLHSSGHLASKKRIKKSTVKEEAPKNREKTEPTNSSSSSNEQRLPLKKRHYHMSSPASVSQTVTDSTDKSDSSIDMSLSPEKSGGGRGSSTSSGLHPRGPHSPSPSAAAAVQRANSTSSQSPSSSHSKISVIVSDKGGNHSPYHAGRIGSPRPSASAASSTGSSARSLSRTEPPRASSVKTNSTDKHSDKTPSTKVKSHHETNQIGNKTNSQTVSIDNSPKHISITSSLTSDTTKSPKISENSSKSQPSVITSTHLQSKTSSVTTLSVSLRSSAKVISEPILKKSLSKSEKHNDKHSLRSSHETLNEKTTSKSEKSTCKLSLRNSSTEKLSEKLSGSKSASQEKLFDKTTVKGASSEKPSLKSSSSEKTVEKPSKSVIVDKPLEKPSLRSSLCDKTTLKSTSDDKSTEKTLTRNSNNDKLEKPTVKNMSVEKVEEKVSLRSSSREKAVDKCSLKNSIHDKTSEKPNLRSSLSEPQIAKPSLRSSSNKSSLTCVSALKANKENTAVSKSVLKDDSCKSPKGQPSSSSKHLKDHSSPSCKQLKESSEAEKSNVSVKSNIKDKVPLEDAKTPKNGVLTSVKNDVNAIASHTRSASKTSDTAGLPLSKNKTEKLPTTPRVKLEKKPPAGVFVPSAKVGGTKALEKIIKIPESPAKCVEDVISKIKERLQPVEKLEEISVKVSPLKSKRNIEDVEITSSGPKKRRVVCDVRVHVTKLSEANLIQNVVNSLGKRLKMKRKKSINRTGFPVKKKKKKKLLIESVPSVDPFNAHPPILEDQTKISVIASLDDSTPALSPMTKSEDISKPKTDIHKMEVEPSSYLKEESREVPIRIKNDPLEVEANLEKDHVESPALAAEDVSISDATIICKNETVLTKIEEVEIAESIEEDVSPVKDATLVKGDVAKITKEPTARTEVLHETKEDSDKKSEEVKESREVKTDFEKRTNESHKRKTHKKKLNDIIDEMTIESRRRRKDTKEVESAISEITETSALSESKNTNENSEVPNDVENLEESNSVDDKVKRDLGKAAIALQKIKDEEEKESLNKDTTGMEGVKEPLEDEEVEERTGDKKVVPGGGEVVRPASRRLMELRSAEARKRKAEADDEATVAAAPPLTVPISPEVKPTTSKRFRRYREELDDSDADSVKVRKKQLPRWKKKYLPAGLLSDYFKEDEPRKPISGDSKKLGSYNRSEHEFGLLPPPAYCAKWVRQRRMPFQLPYDIWWLHTNDQLPGREAVPSWNYKKIRTNVYFDVKPNMSYEAQACSCKPSSKCGEECINRMVLAECSPQLCPCTESCSNQKIQKHEWAPGLVKFMTKDKGWGVKTTQGIKKDNFILEYVGEVVSEREFKARMASRYLNDTHHYCLNLDSGLVIDGHRMGGEGRFVNHSCEPNCEIQKWCVNGLFRMALFALRDISPNEELTYDYNFALFNPAEGQPCKCGSAKCRGVIGGKWQRVAVVQPVGGGGTSGGSSGGQTTSSSSSGTDSSSGGTPGDGGGGGGGGRTPGLAAAAGSGGGTGGGGRPRRACATSTAPAGARQGRRKALTTGKKLPPAKPPKEPTKTGGVKDSGSSNSNSSCTSSTAGAATPVNTAPPAAPPAVPPPAAPAAGPPAPQPQPPRLSSLPPLRPLSAQHRAVVLARRCFLVRNLEKVRLRREKLKPRVKGGGGSSGGGGLGAGNGWGPGGGGVSSIGGSQGSTSAGGGGVSLPPASGSSTSTSQQQGVFLSQLTALSCPERSIRTRRLAMAQDDPEMTKTARLACIFKELYTTVTSAKDEKEGLMSTPFMNVPSKKKSPEYHAKIQNPIDLSTIGSQISSGVYKTVEGFDSDMMSVFKNAIKFHGRTSELGIAAARLRRAYCLAKLDVLSDLQEILGDTPLPPAFIPPKQDPGGEEEDVIRCICGLYRDEGLMIQCERCLVWQHSWCVRASVSPDEEYLCERCSPREVDLEIPAQPENQEPPETGQTNYITLLRGEMLLKQGDTVYVLRDIVNEESTSEPKEKHTYKTIKDWKFTDCDIFRIERLWKDTEGRRFAFGHHYLRPHETFHEPTRKFFPNELMRVPLYEVVPVELVMDHCIVLDLNTYCKGRPLGASPQHIYICEYRVDKAARIFAKISKPKMSSVSTKSYAFEMYDQRLKPVRNYAPHGLTKEALAVNGRSGSQTKKGGSGGGGGQQTDETKPPPASHQSTPHPAASSSKPSRRRRQKPLPIDPKLKREEQKSRLNKLLLKLLAKQPNKSVLDLSYLLEQPGQRRQRKKPLALAS